MSCLMIKDSNVNLSEFAYCNTTTLPVCVYTQAHIYWLQWQQQQPAWAGCDTRYPLI